MGISYKNLWKLLIDKDMKKTELRRTAGISASTFAKLGRNENVTTDVMVKVCKAINRHNGDVMEVVDNYDRFNLNSITLKRAVEYDFFH